MKAIVFFLGFVYDCLLTDSTIALKCGKRRSDCCSGYIYDKDKATCVECPAGYHGPHCNESCPFPSYGVLCRLRCTCGIGYCHNAYDCYIKKTTGMASTITSSPKRNILATLKNNNPKIETSMSTLVSKMTGFHGKLLNGTIHLKMISECLLLVLRLTFVAAFWISMKCSIGYSGFSCQRCPYPRYGDDCKQRCICKPYLCSHIKGCQLPDRCPVGFIGKNCNKQCSYPQYGIGCQKSCMCSRQRCNVFTGCPFTKTVIKNQKSHQTNPFSTDESYPHTTKSVDDINRNARNLTSITPAIPGINKTESMGEPLQQLGVKDGLNKESNANIYVFYSEKKWVMFCFVLFGIMLFLLFIAHIVLSIIQCPSGNRK